MFKVTKGFSMRFFGPVKLFWNIKYHYIHVKTQVNSTFVYTYLWIIFVHWNNRSRFTLIQKKTGKIIILYILIISVFVYRPDHKRFGRKILAEFVLVIASGK